MDSITQIVLGAAVGEAALGKKIGNRAMLWGGIGGTIPDLDIILGPFISEVDALAIHRGFSHSISFAVIGAFLFGWMVYRLYESHYYKWIAFTTRALFFGAIAFGLIYNSVQNQFQWPSLLGGILLIILSGIWMYRRYIQGPAFRSTATLRHWQWLFFLALFTHPLLDSFTMYGTQLFAPFSDYRVAFSTISVADPLYTIPFILCLGVASFMKAGSSRRIWWNYAGLTISSLYLLFTVWNKNRVQNTFERQLAEQEISFNRCILGPSILNNVLWSATIENDSAYYQGQYSLFDSSPIQFRKIEKQHHLIEGSEEDRTIKILKWFCKDFYNIIIRKDGRMQFNDLRYGTFRGTERERMIIFLGSSLTDKTMDLLKCMNLREDHLKVQKKK